jgi:alkylation response protein AidB-like acyl-CoA dehydrogenase
MSYSYQLSSDEEMLLDMVKRVVRERIAQRAGEIDKEGVFPSDIYELFKEMGLMGICIPEEYGGGGQSVLLFCMVLEEIAKVCANSANILSQQDLSAQPILIAGNEVQKNKYLPKLASGEFLAAFGLTEPMAGSDQGGIKTVAIEQNDSYILNGSKCFITWGNIADIITVFAMTDKSLGIKGISAFIVEKDTPGLIVGKLEEKMGMKGSPTAELFFEDCRVPKENLLGNINEGFKIAMKSLNHGRAVVGAMAIGIAQGAMDYAISYANERTQFGSPIINFQGLQFMIADRLTEIEAARELVYRAAFECDINGREIIKLGAMAKMFATDVAMKTTVDAVQIMGGYGYMKDHPLERMMRDVKVTQIVEGTNQIQKIVIINHVLKNMGK